MSVWPAVWLTLQLAAVTTAILMIIAVPLAWWLATTKARTRPLFEALTALPLVLPPTVLGFYLLVLMRPDAPIGGLWVQVTGQTLAFSFSGLVLASVVYSLPFAVQPMQAAFAAVPQSALDAARTLGASPRDALLTVALPLARRGFLTGAVLSFAHTVGEFGVILMIGGSIPGETKVLSIAIYDYVETLRWQEAHILSAGMVVFAFLVILTTALIDRRSRR
ncbi:MAG: molybdate ABC transporter permease subunit, partial [Pseudomonadota bacterium]